MAAKPRSDAPSRKLLDTVVELLVEQGYEGVSVRKVAAAAGVSIGAVQHHLPTKDVMLKAASDEASRTFQQHLARLVSHQATAEQALRALAHGLLGTDDELRAASVLWILRAARAATDRAVADEHAASWKAVEDLITDLLRAARPDRPNSVARERAGLLLALIDGLALSALTEPDRMPADRAHHILDQQLTDEVTATERLTPTDHQSPQTRST